MAIRLPFPYLRLSWRNVSLHTLSSDGNDETTQSKWEPKEELRSRILRLKFPRRSATTVLQNWIDEGNDVFVSELRRISKQLVERRRYKHALEILNWIGDQGKFRMTAADHAMKLQLICKVNSLKVAEIYFDNLPDIASQKAACLPLLHSYVKEKAAEKAEALMMKMTSLGLIVSPHPFNAIMKLYMATSQFDKVLSVILLMKQKKIARNVLSYNLWMSASGFIHGAASAEIIYKEMIKDKQVEVGWSSLATLANIYLKSGLIEQATMAIRNAEKKLSNCDRFAYFFLITLYSSVNDKDGILRLWKACNAVEGRITCTNYMCILLCMVKVGEIGEAEKIFLEWESQCRKYDIRVSNILLGAYMRNGSVAKAESLHLHTLKRGGSPNYKTWEILMEGWIKNKEMDKAIDAMKKGFAMLKHCNWRPSPGMVVAIAQYFEKSGNLEDAKQYLKVLRRLDLASD